MSPKTYFTRRNVFETLSGQKIREAAQLVLGALFLLKNHFYVRRS